MSFIRYFKGSSYCLIASGFVALAATGSIDVFSLLLYTSALAASWSIDTPSFRSRLPGWLLNSIAVFAFPLTLADYFLISRSFVVSTVHLIFLLAAAKLLTLSTDRDYVYLYFVSFAQLLAASTLTIDITFVVSLFVFLLTSISTLILFEMKRSHARAQGQGKIQPVVVARAARGTGLELFSPFPAGSIAGLSVGMTLTILVLSVPIFFLTPRISLGLYNRPSGRTQMISGFSETVELGEIGNIKESDAIVMRVKLGDKDAVPENMKWRGVALDHYNGRAWSRSPAVRERFLLPADFRTIQRQEFMFDRASHRPQILHQTFFLQALSTRVVFAGWRPLTISGDLGSLLRDGTESLYSGRSAQEKLSYQVISDVRQPDGSEIPDTLPAAPAFISETYLQVPSLDVRVAELARTVTRASRNPYRKAQRLEQYLKWNYGYSLELKGTPNSPDPLAMFLFELRKGHCEYFATAMTVMLRQLDIPARIVNGFRSGEYNRLGSSWTVRQYDAHSWVEAYFAGSGWVEFDPTPPDPVHSRSAFIRLVANLSDALDLWWTDEVVNYTFWKQIRMLGSARAQFDDLRREMKSMFAHYRDEFRTHFDRIDLRTWITQKALPIAIGLGVVLVAYFVFLRNRRDTIVRFLRRRWRAWGGGSEGRIIVGFYADALELLQARGLARSRSQTPLEFAASLSGHPAAQPLHQLTEIYNRVRFGSHESTEDLPHATSLLASLKGSLKTK